MLSKISTGENIGTLRMSNFQIAEKECAHCFHRTGRITSARPPYMEERCCWCGKWNWAKPESPAPSGEHGPFVPAPNGKEVFGILSIKE